jgi:copper chaperone CopZ
METKLKVTGMTCMHCVGTVTKALENVPGVEKAEVSLETGQANVTGNAKMDSLLAAVKEEGYEAQLM